jgi:glycosyltransferase involved in cell wall biosynthesis
MYALGVYETMRARDDVDPIVLTRIEAASREQELAPITPISADGREYLLHTKQEKFDWFFGRYMEKAPLAALREFLEAQRPDLVHFQHSVLIGYDALRVTRTALPDAPIVYMLHEYWPICFNDGQMVRTMDNELCSEDSPRRCHECFAFKYKTESDFFARKRFIRSHMKFVDLFLTPSSQARDQYIRWGIPPERVRVQRHGFRTRPLAEPETGARADRPRDRFAYFGQFTAWKGVDVLLRAIAQLGDRFTGHLWLHASNYEDLPAEPRARMEPLLEAVRDKVTFAGAYDHAALPELMANVDWVVVPSIWRETGPLTVQEAFIHGRPVICSDIGGMIERVRDGVNGLHFRRADPSSLAERLLQAQSTAGLWEKLRAGIPPVPTMDEHADALAVIYRELLSRRPSDFEQSGLQPALAGPAA